MLLLKLHRSKTGDSLQRTAVITSDDLIAFAVGQSDVVSGLAHDLQPRSDRVHERRGAVRNANDLHPARNVASTAFDSAENQT